MLLNMVLPGEVEPAIDEYTLLLLHGEDFEDSSQYGHTVTNNGVTVSTAHYKFGGKSLYFNGSSYLSITDASFAAATQGDFTIDWWQYKTVANGSIFAYNVLTNTGYSQILAQHAGGTKLYYSYTGGTWDVAGVTAFAITPNVWQHWAIVKSGTTLTTYLNGNQYWSGTIANSFSGGAGQILLGCHADASNRDYITGYVDEFRVSNIARWTSTFVPPTAPYGSDESPSGSDFTFTYTGSYTDNRENGVGTVRFNSSGTLAVMSGTATVSAYIQGAGGGAQRVAIVYDSEDGYWGNVASGAGGGNQTVEMTLSPGTYEITIGAAGIAGQDFAPPSTDGGNTTAFGYTSTGGSRAYTDSTGSTITAGTGGTPNGGNGSFVTNRFIDTVSLAGGTPNGGAITNGVAQNGGSGYVELTFI